MVRGDACSVAPAKAPITSVDAAIAAHAAASSTAAS
jgi:hypothetical protein